MTSIDAYGEFELPEEKIEIEVVEDPVKTIISCYEYFTEINEKAKFMQKGKEETYQAALKIFEGKEKLKIDYEQTQTILQRLNQKEDIDSLLGLFLSALINSTSIENLIIEKYEQKYIQIGKDKQCLDPIDYLGFRLAPNKTILIGKNITAYYAGSHCKGNIINNGRIINHFVENVISGIQINNEFAQDFAWWPEGGLQINNNQVQGNFGREPKNGIQINNGTVYAIAWWGKGGIQINAGETIRNFPSLYEGGIQINVGKVKKRKIKEGFEAYNKQINLTTRNTKTQKQKRSRIELLEKLKEIEFLKQIKELPYQEQARQVNAFDYKKFEKEMIETCERIKKVCGR